MFVYSEADVLAAGVSAFQGPNLKPYICLGIEFSRKLQETVKAVADGGSDLRE